MENTENATSDPATDIAKEAEKKDKQNKIEILLQPAPNAPILRQKKWTVDTKKTVGMIMGFIAKYLKLDANERIFLYVNQTFAPSPDTLIKNLHECYNTNGQLVLHYCKAQAWG